MKTNNLRGKISQWRLLNILQDFYQVSSKWRFWTFVPQIFSLSLVTTILSKYSFFSNWNISKMWQRQLSKHLKLEDVCCHFENRFLSVYYTIMLCILTSFQVCGLFSLFQQYLVILSVPPQGFNQRSGVDQPLKSSSKPSFSHFLFNLLIKCLKRDSNYNPS